MMFFVELSISTEKLLPSIVQAPKLELKPLPEQLKYVILGENYKKKSLFVCYKSTKQQYGGLL